jgi:hypothetical protein
VLAAMNWYNVGYPVAIVVLAALFVINHRGLPRNAGVRGLLDPPPKTPRRRDRPPHEGAHILRAPSLVDDEELARGPIEPLALVRTRSQKIRSVADIVLLWVPILLIVAWLLEIADELGLQLTSYSG